MRRKPVLNNITPRKFLPTDTLMDLVIELYRLTMLQNRLRAPRIVQSGSGGSVSKVGKRRSAQAARQRTRRSR
jgi:hypothetical protein